MSKWMQEKLIGNKMHQREIRMQNDTKIKHEKLKGLMQKKAQKALKFVQQQQKNREREREQFATSNNQ